MNKKRAFTLTEIIIVVVLSTIVLGVVYKLFSGVMGQMFKSSNKMTNLRAASLILERMKNDIRCSAIPIDDSEDSVIEEDEFSFITTSLDGTDNISADEPRRRVTYKLDGNELRRSSEGGSSDRKISSAKVSSFSVTLEPGCTKETSRYITVTIIVDNELDSTSRGFSSKSNQVKLQAVLYPRFFSKARTEEEIHWYDTYIE